MSVDAEAPETQAVEMAHSLIPLGKAIRLKRETLGWSQEKLADRCGFDRTYISMLERGKRNPSFLNLLRVADGLETSIASLTEDYENGADTDR